jgi:SAM-dependent methyltransferase
MNYITLQRKAGWSSLKEYSRWDEVVRLVEAQTKLPVVELDAIRDWDVCFELVKNARLHLGIDSVYNHAAAAYKTPAVILFGSTDPIGSGHLNATNLRNALCGPTPCFIEDRYTNGHRFTDKCPHGNCIDSITPEAVSAAVLNILAPCPVCGSTKETKAVKEHDTPYYACAGCGLWRQLRVLPKTFESSAELPGDQMSPQDKSANREISNYIQPYFVVPGKHLSIGSKYPMLAHWLQTLHGRKCIAIDGIPEVVKFGKELGVEAYQHDAEKDIPGGPYASVDMVHVLEHLYNPIETLNKIADVMVPGAVLFIRSPNWDMSGIVRDLTRPHYEIHPHIYNETSFKALIEKVPAFKLLHYHGWQPGQFDVFVIKT